MNKAEEAALKAYPKCKPDHFGIYSLEYSTVLSGREGFQKGYEQAKKDTIERAVRWIAENTKRYVGPIEHPFWDMFLKHFRKYMEEE